MYTTIAKEQLLEEVLDERANETGERLERVRVDWTAGSGGEAQHTSLAA